MDEDVIRSFNVYFSQCLVLNNLIQKNVFALDSVRFMKDAWECLVANCFRKSGLSSEGISVSNHNADDCYLLISGWLKKWYLQFQTDEDLKISEIPMQTDIIQTVQSKEDSADANNVCVEETIPTKSVEMLMYS